MTAQQTGSELERRGGDRTAAVAERIRMEPPAADLRDAINPIAAVCAILAAVAATIGAADGDVLRAVSYGLPAAFFAVYVLRGGIWSKKVAAEELQDHIDRVVELIESVFELAQRRRGVLTVTEIASDPDLDLTLEAAEQLLIDLDDGSTVRSSISAEGVIYYEFAEFLGMEERNAPK